MLANAPETPLLVLMLLTSGGTLLAVVSAIRRYRAGEIVDDDAVIRRLDADNMSLRAQRDSAMDRENMLRLQMYAWQEQAVAYRVQLMSAGLSPLDREVWIDHGME